MRRAKTLVAMAVTILLVLHLGGTAAARPDTKRIVQSPSVTASSGHARHVLTPSPAVTAASTVAPSGARLFTTTVFSDSFESESSQWTMGDPGWGRTTYRASAGSWSMYCAQSQVPAPGPYPEDMYTWMIAGPFDLTGFDQAVLEFDMWLDTEADYDEVFVGMSSNGEEFYGQYYSGGAGAWTRRSISGFAGRAQVWICIEFMSDWSISGEGAYLDNLRLLGHKYNLAPVANPDYYSTYQGHVLDVAAPGVLANDADHEGDPFTVALVEGATHGTVDLRSDGSFTYVPDPGFVGNDHFDYEPTDGGVGNSSRVYITVAEVVPITASDYYETWRDQRLNVSAPGVLGNDSEPDGRPMTARLCWDVNKGTLDFHSDGSFAYTPPPGYTGWAHFSYAAESGGSSELTDVQILVSAPLPIPTVDRYRVRSDRQLVVAAPGVLANDVDPLGRVLCLEDFAQPLHGTAELSADGALVYTPDPAYFGWDQFQYRVRAGQDIGVGAVSIAVELPPRQFVARYYNTRTGTHLYTADLDETYYIYSQLSHIYRFEGTAYILNPEKNDCPLYRFYRPSTNTHFYTASAEEAQRVQATLSGTFRYEGRSFSVSLDSAGGTKRPVYRFYNVRTGCHFYTADEAERDNVQRTLGYLYSYDGIAFYLGQ